VSWSVAGTQGPQGLQGPQGPPGAPVDSATTILNQSAQAQAASLFVNGQLRSAAGLRLGSETGTSLAPVYPGQGLVVRSEPQRTPVFVDGLSLRCTFGSPDGHQADLVLSRSADNSPDWQGFITTTTNQ
jgi:hypothetical protein